MMVGGRLKVLFTRGRFDAEFITAAQEELPYLWGRMALLEEFYALSMHGGDPDRIPQLHAQLGTPQRFHGSPLRKLKTALFG